MNKRFLQAFLILLFGLSTGYAAYFLVLQYLDLTSPIRFGLVAGIVVLSAGALNLGYSKVELTRKMSAGIFALFILANLIAIVPIGFENFPYTITLLPVRSFALQVEASQNPVQLVEYGTSLYQDLNFNQFEIGEGWQVKQNGSLLQAAGNSGDLTWTGKPGESIYFVFRQCQTCTVTISNSIGAILEFNLQGEPSEQTVLVSVSAGNLTAHRALNVLSFEAALLAVSALVWAGLSRIRLGWKLRLLRVNVSSLPERYRNFLPIIIIILFPVVLFSFKIEPIIFNDDWCQLILPMNEGTFDFFILNSRRPMHLSVGWVFYKFLSLQGTIYAMQIAHLVILAATGVLVYFLLRKILYGAIKVALFAALLWMIFPNDYTHFYLSILGIRAAHLLTLAGFYLFIKYLESDRLSYVLAASVLHLVSYFMYEAQLGLILVWPVAALFIYRKKRWLKNLSGMLIYYASTGIFLLWRLIVHPNFYQDSKLTYLEFSLPALLRAYLLGLKTILGGFQFPYQDASWITLENILILTASAIVILSAYLLARGGRFEKPNDDTLGPTTGFHLRLLGVGAILWAAGYIPIILNYQPNIWGHLSRVNIIPNLGAILIIVAVLKMLFDSILEDRTRWGNLVVLVLAFLVLFAGVVQVQVQESFADSWQDVKTFYQELFEAVPQVRAGTHMVIYLSGDEQDPTYHRPIFSSNWEPVCALQVLYDQPDLQATAIYEDSQPDPSRLITIGFAMGREASPQIFDIGQVLGVEYDQSGRSLTVLDNGDFLFEKGDRDAYQPWDRILPLEEKIDSRELVN